MSATIPEDCLPDGYSCEEYGEAGYWDGVCIDTGTACECEWSDTETETATETGTWSTDGTTLTTDAGSNRAAQTVDYCSDATYLDTYAKAPTAFRRIFEKE